MRQYAVIGLGNFGANVAIALAKAGHEIIAIDRNGRKVEEIKDYVTQAAVADATDKAVVSELIPGSIEAVTVAMGDNLEASILATLVLKELGIKQIIVKAVGAQHARALELIGATEVVQPERDAALALAERLTTPNVLNMIALSPEYTIADVGSPESFWGRSLGEMQVRTRYDVLVMAVRDLLHNQTHILPGPEFKIEPDTVMTVLGRYEAVARLTK